MPERCDDCPLDATHTLRWRPSLGAWRTCKFGRSTVRPWNVTERYCHWHATVHIVQRNAQGVQPAMQELHKRLATGRSA